MNITGILASHQAQQCCESFFSTFCFKSFTTYTSWNPKQYLNKAGKKVLLQKPAWKVDTWTTPLTKISTDPLHVYMNPADGCAHQQCMYYCCVTQRSIQTLASHHQSAFMEKNKNSEHHTTLIPLQHHCLPWGQVTLTVLKFTRFMNSSPYPLLCLQQTGTKQLCKARTGYCTYTIHAMRVPTPMQGIRVHSSITDFPVQTMIIILSLDRSSGVA